MKPLRLSMQAFGPYLEEQVLDFETLARQGLFLIHGPTGAGKTTIFDALTYAFYGAASGDDRKADRLRSDHAPADLRTVVSLDFALGGTSYRIVRKAEFDRPRLKGEGTVREAATADLYRLEQGEEVEKVASGWEKVNKASESLLKLGLKQFTQVIILPQGQFRRFLSGTSGEREKILEILFRTTRYKKIQENLDARASAIAKGFKSQEDERRGLLKSFEGAESVEVIHAGLAKAKAAALVLRQSAEALKEKRDALGKSLQAAEESKKLFTELENAQKAKALVDEASPAIAELAKELEAARGAEPVRVFSEKFRELNHTANALAASLPAAKEDHEATAAALASAEASLKAAAGREGEKAKLEERLAALKTLGTELVELEKKREELAKAKLAEKAEADKTAALNKDLHALEISLPALREKEHVLQAQAESAGLHEENLKQARAQLEEGRAVAEARRHFAANANALFQSKITQAQSALAQAEAAHTKAQDLWMRGQAAVLAANLKEGDPCPVCGSADHPNLARGGEAPNDSLKASNLALEAARAALTAAEKEKASADAARSAQDSVLQAREARLKAEGFADLSSWEAETKRRADLSQQSAAAKLAYVKVRGDIQAADKKLSETRAALKALEKNSETARGVLHSLSGQVAQTEERLAKESLSTVEEAREAYKSTNATILEIKNQSGAAQAARDTSLRSSMAAAEKLRGLEARQAETASMLATAELAFQSALKEHGFSSAEAFATALRPFARTKELQEKIQAHEQAKSSASTRLSLAEKATAGKSSLDPTPLMEAFQAAERSLREENEKAAQAEAKAKHTEDLLARIARLEAEMAGAHEEYKLFGELAEVAKGTNEKGMSFQRYVLATFLDEVVENASLRLRQSSKGRYSLKRATSHEDLRKTGGLELVVEDAWHDTVRPVSTLSGGEGFQASLAMALGLAEVVQAEAGGVYLDAVFVDEGFGTLDADALDLAIRTLMDMQKGGRLVGLISHVPELKQIIQARVEIKPDRAGSRIVSDSFSVGGAAIRN